MFQYHLWYLAIQQMKSADWALVIVLFLYGKTMWNQFYNTSDGKLYLNFST